LIVEILCVKKHCISDIITFEFERRNKIQTNDFTFICLFLTFDVMSKQEMQNMIVDFLINFQPQVIGIFGSYSRNEQTSKSDLDIFIRFNVCPSLLQLIRIENELSEKLNVKVDLVTEGSIRNETIKKAIQKDLQIIYQA
jgi:uncharacterized protein